MGAKKTRSKEALGQSQRKDAHRPVVLGRGPHRVESLLELIDIRFARQKRYAQYQLDEDSADRPYIDSGRIMTGTPEQFWWPVPAVRQSSLGSVTHRVMTWHVMRLPASAYSRARPKSAILSSPSELISRLFGFRSCTVSGPYPIPDRSRAKREGVFEAGSLAL